MKEYKDLDPLEKFAWRRRADENERVDDRPLDAQLRIAEREGEPTAAILAIAIALRELNRAIVLPPGYRCGYVWLHEGQEQYEETPIIALEVEQGAIKPIELRRTEGISFEEAEADYYLAPGEAIGIFDRKNLLTEKLKREERQAKARSDGTG